MKFPFIDTHAHLYSDQFAEDRDAMVQRAINAGVEYVLLPNIDESSIHGMHALVAAFPDNCFPMMGLHPCSITTDWEATLQHMETLLDKGNYIAVGEIGIDLYWDKSLVNEQKEAFRTQLRWAKARKLPVVIHARDSFPEIFEVVDEENDENLTGIFHCFTGTLEDAQRILNYGGFLMGIGGVVTYKTSHLPEILPQIPLSAIVLETDAPYLPPVPFRGKRNESAYLIHTAEKVAEVYGIPLAELQEITTKNAIEVFKLNQLIVNS